MSNITFNGNRQALHSKRANVNHLRTLAVAPRTESSLYGIAVAALFVFSFVLFFA